MTNEKFFDLTCDDRLEEEAAAAEVDDVKYYTYNNDKDFWYDGWDEYNGWIAIKESSCFHFKDGSPHIDFSFKIFADRGITGTVRSWKDWRKVGKYLAKKYNLKLLFETNDLFV